MIHLAWPWVLALLPLPWLLQRWLPPALAQGGALFAPFALGLGGDAAAQRVHTRRQWRRWLVVLAWLGLLLAAARPEWLGAPLSLPQSGRNLLLAIDVSGSMETPDLGADGSQATRLDVVKQVAGEFIARRSGDRVGLILFGSQAYLQSPLTFDHVTVRHFLDEAVIGVAGRETAIGDAIGLAVKRLRAAPGGAAVLVLLTDGQNTAGAVAPRQAAQLAAQNGLRIYTIGVGADRVRVQGLFGTQVVNPSADLDEATLKAIAATTGGRYFRARDRAELASVYATLDQLEPVAGTDRQVRPVTALYPWPLGLALLLSLALATAALWRRPAA
ncbi:MAG: VWA domain-containing protein [Pseudomonadota bacterium]